MDRYALLTKDCIKTGKHIWVSTGGRPCPFGNPLCSQVVYQCIFCEFYDFGEKGGPGHKSCKCCKWTLKKRK